MEKDFMYPLIDIKRTGEWLRFLCKMDDISVNDLQSRLQIASNQAIYSWFNGRTLPSINNMYVLSALLQRSINDLLVDNVNEHPLFRGACPTLKRAVLYACRLKLPQTGGGKRG